MSKTKCSMSSKWKWFAGGFFVSPIKRRIRRKAGVVSCKPFVEEFEPRLVPACPVVPLNSTAIGTMLTEQNAVMNLVPLANATDELIASGNWSNPADWKSGHLPGAGANIEIDPGIQEVYDLASSPAYNSIRIDGELSFTQSASTGLLVQTIVNTPTGTFTDLQPNPSITSTITFADPGPLDLVNDPKELGRGYLAVGLMNADGTMGAMATTNIVGAQKDGWESIGGVNAGATSLSLQSVPNGWLPGDRLLFPGTGVGSQDEQDTISSVSADGKTFQLSSPLAFNHNPPVAHNGPLTTTVADLTRNIVFNSQTPGPLRGGHIMFMHTMLDTINYVEMDGLGRTDKSKPLNATTVDPGNGEVVTNVAGRYALHFHRLYNFSDACRVDVVGDVVTNGPGWGFDNHSSNVVFTDNIDYGTFGAGFVTEAGDETGSFTHDLSVHNVGNNTKLLSAGTGETSGTGDRGFGFWIQGKYGVGIESCVAAESGMAGYWFEGVGLNQSGGFGVTPFWTMNITDPTLIPKGSPTSVSVGSLPQVDFSGNSFEFGNEGFWWRGQPNAPTAHDQVNNFTAWGVVRIGMEFYYEGTGHIDGAILLGGPTDKPGSQTGIQTTFGYSNNVELSNLDVEGFALHGVEVAGKGTNLIDDAGYFDNPINFYVQLADTAGTLTFTGSDPVFGQQSNVPGGYNYYFLSMLGTNAGPNVDRLDIARFRPWVAYMNTPSHPNQQIYMLTQAWNASPWISRTTGLDDPTLPTAFSPFQLAAFSDADKAMTNGELWTAYGRTVGGYAAPADAVTLSGSNVLIAEPQPTLAPYAIGWSPNGQSEWWNSPKFTNQETGYIAKFSDENGNQVILPAQNLHEGWDFLVYSHNGHFGSIMVFGDTQSPVLTLDPKQVLSVTLAQLSQPFTVKWTYFDNELTATPVNYNHTYNLLNFTIQTDPVTGNEFIVIPIIQKDDAGNSTELDVTITVTM